MRELAGIDSVGEMMAETKTAPDTMSRKEAARYLTALGYPITARTLENKAANNNAGRGPAFSRFGWRSVRYARVDLEAWAARESRRVE